MRPDDRAAVQTHAQARTCRVVARRHGFLDAVDQGGRLDAQFGEVGGRVDPWPLWLNDDRLVAPRRQRASRIERVTLVAVVDRVRRSALAQLTRECLRALAVANCALLAAARAMPDMNLYSRNRRLDVRQKAILVGLTGGERMPRRAVRAKAKQGRQQILDMSVRRQARLNGRVDKLAQRGVQLWMTRGLLDKVRRQQRPQQAVQVRPSAAWRDQSNNERKK